MALDIPLQNTSTGQQAISLFEPKIWTKISTNTKNVKTTASFTHALKREVLSKYAGKQVAANSKQTLLNNFLIFTYLVSSFLNNLLFIINVFLNINLEEP